MQILIDGQAAYQEISDAFKRAKKFIYLTISYCELHGFPVSPGKRRDTMFDILKVSRQGRG